MQTYNALIQEILDQGSWQNNRTGTPCLFIPGALLRIDLAKGFPALTTRRLPVKGAIGEMIGFLRGYTNAADFRSLGCQFWNENANDEPSWLASPHRQGPDDLGQIYGAVWRRFPGDDGLFYDQVKDALETLHKDPTNRRIIVNGWRPDFVKNRRGALPPCHVAHHYMTNIATRELHLCMWQRSCDTVLGLGSNIVGYAFLLAWVARLTGYTPRWLILHLDDVHIYEPHLENLKVQMAREPRPLPRLVFDEAVHEFHRDGFDSTKIEAITPDQVHLEGYDPHPRIYYKMVV